jgi:outer membrane lipoprotein-sorting protein
MLTVEIRLAAGELREQMSAMRMWLDERRWQPSVFSSRDDGRGVRLSIAFKNAGEGEAFARRFGGRLNRQQLAA